MTDSPVYRFQHFELRPNKHQLVVDGRQVTLGSRALDVLEALASRAGELMTKQELLDRVWPHAIVQEANLTVQISTLRKELGPDVIATIPGRGYRLIASAPADEWPDVGAPAIAAETPAAPETAPKLRTNLLGWTRPMLGREADLDTLHALVRQHRLVTIAGAGGMGKTLLARHLLLDPPAAFRHGVCWVELTATSDPAALPAAVAAALGLALRGGDAMAQLAAWLAPLELLLALDNAEHLLADVAALVQGLHDAAPGVRFVVTSQAPLRLAAESVYRLEPLAVPPLTSLPLDDALRFGAVALLVERALAADARFALTDEAVPLLVEVCRALDGVPLSLELAAARAPMLGLPQLLQSLRERMRVLNVNSDRWAPARQQTLRQAHEWSYRLLAQPEQEAFRRLGVLVGSASLSTMQALASDGSLQPADAWAALDSLSILVDRSLIVLLRARDDAHPVGAASPRYRLLESSRLFALEQLRGTDELAGARRVHAQRMAGLCDAAWDARWSGEVGIEAWADAIKPDLDDALEAFTWASSSDEPALAVRIARTLLFALPVSQQQQRGLLAEFCEIFAGDDLLPAHRVQAWVAVCSHWIDRNGTRAVTASETALALARQHMAEGGDPFWLYFALSQRVALHARNSELARARQLTADMRDLAQAHIALRWPPHRLLAGAGAENHVVRAAGDMQQALTTQRKLLELQQAAGGNMFLSLTNLMDVEIAAGDAASAVQTGLQLLQQLQGSREEHSLTSGQLNLLAAWLAVGETARARELAEAAWSAACRFQQQAFWADYLALLACQESRFRAAARLAGFSEQAYADDGSARDHNEAVAYQRAVTLTRAALGDAEFDRLASAGRLLSDDDVSRCAFSPHDAA